MFSRNTSVKNIGLVILIIYLLYCLLKKNYLENFIVLIEKTIIPKNCPNYLVTDGNDYYLLNTKKPFNRLNNPLKFNTLDLAKQYLKQNECPNLKPINLVVSKSNLDPTVNYEQECNNIVSHHNFNEDICGTYSDTEKLKNLKDYTNNLLILTEKQHLLTVKIKNAKKIGNNDLTSKNELEEINSQIDLLKENYKQNSKNLKEMVDYDVETCMMNKMKMENNNLDDTNFMDNFAKYFNNLNENIGQSYSM